MYSAFGINFIKRLIITMLEVIFSVNKGAGGIHENFSEIEFLIVSYRGD